MENKAPIHHQSRNLSEDLRLLGVMHFDQSAAALLLHQEKGVVRLRQGQSLEGWKAKEFGRDRVALERAGRVEWLEMKKSPLREKM
jgi:type II secretory pathway component PulC